MQKQKFFFAYILRSEKFPAKTYKGYTEKDVCVRLSEHNTGTCSYTKQFVPWDIEFFCAFKDKLRAISFEKYLKSASEIAFSRKRLLRNQ